MCPKTVSNWASFNDCNGLRQLTNEFQLLNLAQPSCQPLQKTFSTGLKIALDFITNGLPFSCEGTRRRKKQEGTVSIADAKEMGVDAAVAVVPSEFGSIFSN